MHLKSIIIHSQSFPTKEQYPFNQSILHLTPVIEFKTLTTFFVGENGTGKSTLLEAIAKKCQIYIWRDSNKKRFQANQHEGDLYRYISIEWTDGRVPGSYFESDSFRYFSYNVDEWAASDPGVLKYLGGQSLVTQSHGQSLIAYFKARSKVRGLYLLDEPETALSPKSQLELIKLMVQMSRTGSVQFIIATHSPILMACPQSTILKFEDSKPINQINYEDTDHFLIYKDFLEDRSKYL